MKVVYCLSGRSADIVTAMVRLSIATVRLTNPDARVEILVDHESLVDIQRAGNRVLDDADHVHSCVVPEGPAALRSRHLKTRIRAVVQGAFLFLDADTVVRKPLSRAWPGSIDVAACPNYCGVGLHEQLGADEAAYLNVMGWPVPASYLNSGVIYFADSPRAHVVGDTWQAVWTAGVHRTGRRIDQPAFNHAVHSSGAALQELSSGWNSQIVRAPATTRDAMIWHYYHSCERAVDTPFAIEAQRLSPRGSVDRSVARQLVSAELPWATDSWVRRRVVELIMRRGQVTPLMSMMLAREYPQAAHLLGRASLTRLRRPFTRI